MQKADQGDFEPFDAHRWKIGIVVAEFNKPITEALYRSAVGRAAKYNVQPHDIHTIRVAGSVEIPLALQAMAKSGKYKALLAIGCVIKGDTPHFDYVCQMVADGVLRIQLDQHVPVGFGVLTCNTYEQALSRAHLGGEHLDAAMHLAKALQ